jgi:hypothetical protein
VRSGTAGKAAEKGCSSAIIPSAAKAAMISAVTARLEAAPLQNNSRSRLFLSLSPRPFKARAKSDFFLSL